MNLCIIKGEVTEEVEFNFFYRCKQISIAKARILLENGSSILIKGYDELADWMYHYIQVSDIVFILWKIIEICFNKEKFKKRFQNVCKICN